MVGDATESSPVNRLASEQSPYLLQHAHQPVAWWPWCPEAFEEARHRNVPVMISIGYATCHWCHVMAHESFDDPTIAAYLNQHYVSIKVDREERPDVDAFYMDVCQAMTGHGGWPLTIFADAERRPFFTGTYFPPQSRAGRIGFGDLLARINHAWTTQPDQVRTAATEIVETMQAAARQSARGDMPADVFNRVADYHRSTFDDTYGGFRIQPKFPSPHHLLLLFRIGYRSGDTELIRMATTTLDAMRAGGIYDHVGFGLHRYSTDREWLLPHFEKMLYDQAMVMLAYTEAWQITGRPLYRQTCEEIADYLQREMTSPTGAFYSAQDADSEGVEGKYYVWSYSELASHLSADDLAWLCEHRGLTPDGNMHDEATGDATGTTILHLPKKQADPHHALANDGVLVDRWESIRRQLLPHRQRRVPPLTDDKILVDWNGLMIGALAVAGRTFQHPQLIEQAQRAYADVVRCCGGSTWVHRFRGGERAVEAMLDDHACIGWAAAELYHSTGDEAYLHDAEWHAQHLLEQFVDRSEGGDGALLMVADGRSDVPVQYRQGYDGAYPCGNSMAAMLLVDLGRTKGQQQYLDAAYKVCTSYAQSMEKLSSGFCMLLCAWDAVLHDATEIVYVGDQDDPLLQAARHHFASQYRPGIVHLWADDRMSSAMRTTYAVDSAPRPSVLICRGGACQLPITTIEQIHAHRWPQEG